VTPRAPKEPAKAKKTATRTAADAAAPAQPVEPAVADAGAPAVEPAPDRLAGIERIVVFAIEGQRYALPIDVVQEIQQIVAVSEIPDDSGAVVGVINVRGAVVPVMDLRRMLGMAQRPYDLQTPMVFVRSPRGIVSLVVDEVEDVMEVPEGSMQAPSSVFALADRLLGVCRLDSGPVFVFDVERLVPAANGGRP